MNSDDIRKRKLAEMAAILARFSQNYGTVLSVYRQAANAMGGVPSAQQLRDMRVAAEQMSAQSQEMVRVAAQEIERVQTAVDSTPPDLTEAVLHIPADPYLDEIRVDISDIDIIDSILARLIKQRLCYCGEQPDIRQEPCPSVPSRAGDADESQPLCEVCVFIAKYLPDAQDWR